MNNYQSIPFKDEDGKEKEFYVLEQTTLNGFHYLLVEDGRWLKTRKNLYQYPKYLSS